MSIADHELVKRSRAGQKEAFAQLVQRYQALVRGLAFSVTRDEALSEDIAQETLVTAWRTLPQLRESKKFRSWLCGITRNVARSARRQQQRHAPSGNPQWVSDLPSDRPGPAQMAMDRQAHDLVERALGDLSDAYRLPLILFYREQRSLREVASDLQLSEDTVKQRLSRGRLKLRHGVDALVERSLRTPRLRRRDLGAAVLAAIAVIGQSGSASAATGSVATLSTNASTKVAAAALCAIGLGVGATLLSVTSSSASSVETPVVVEQTVAGNTANSAGNDSGDSAALRGLVHEHGPSQLARDAVVKEQVVVPSQSRSRRKRRGRVRHGPARVEHKKPLVVPTYVHPIFADPDTGRR